MSPEAVDKAISALKEGQFVLVYDADGREEETDFFVAAELITPDHVRIMRQDGGGLIFLMVHHDVCETFQLPFMTDLYDSAREVYPALQALVPDDIPYDSKSSFSLAINHRKTFTGITDKDRALTIRDFAQMAGEGKNADPKSALNMLRERFRSPGHVPICRSSSEPLSNRFGHTELAVALSMMAGLTPVMAGCEMMGDDGGSKPNTLTRKYAEDNGHIYVEGADIIRRFRQWSR